MPATDEYWRSLPLLHRIFALSAFVLLAATVLMMVKDESREWRDYQAEAERLEVERLQEQKAELNTGSFRKQLAELEEKKADAEKALGERRSRIEQLKAELPALQGRVDVLAVESKAKNAERDKARADYDILVRDQAPEAQLATALEDFERRQQLALEMALKLEQAKTELDGKQSELNLLTEQVAEVESEIKKFESQLTQVQEQIEQLRPTDTLASIKRAIKEWPIVNAFNPILKIQYDWPAELEQQLGMARVSRVDRCRSCHVNINDFGAGNVPNYPSDDYEQPFTSHPRPDLYLTASSPHPISKFGCTICHEGDGSGTSFQTAEHTPANPAQAEEWKEKYGWHSNHFWEYPMLPKHSVESSCLKCHHNVIELGVNEEYGPTAETAYEGYSLIREYGCFGCHEINGYDGARPIGPDFRLEPGTPEELAKVEADPNMVPGQMRKVGPSLRHIGSKVTPEFIAYWTEEPKRFRPTTRMPQFFNLTNQHDALAGLLQPVELAGIATYLTEKSEPLKYDEPQEGYVPDAERGKLAFEQRGCLACHSHSDEQFKELNASFGPELSRVHEKIKPGPEGFKWLYTWLRDPTRYHARTKMPNLMLTPSGEGDSYVDPAADIAAFLLAGGPKEFPALAQVKPYVGVVLDDDFTLDESRALGIPKQEFAGVRVTEVLQGSPAARAERQVGDSWTLQPLDVDDVITAFNGEPVKSPDHFRELEASVAPGQTVALSVISGRSLKEYRVAASTAVDDLTRLYLQKALSHDKLEKVLSEHKFPLPDAYTQAVQEGKEVKLSEFIKGDEIELAPQSSEEQVDDATWRHRQLTYIGRRTISRYGCYGCHDIPGFEEARPIGTALQDWGRKDTSKLAFEHIHEYLEHHGEPDGSSTIGRAERAVKNAHGASRDEQELKAAYFVESALHHGRPGFIWQKLRQPRSYDYHKTETKGWDERLRMPKFPFNEQEIASITTFVLGLVSDPPKPSYQYRPDGAEGARIEGERLLAKFNCAGCHMLEMPRMEFGANLDQLKVVSAQITDEERPAWELLKEIKPPQGGLTGEKLESGDPLVAAHGFIQQYPDPQEDPEFQLYSFVLWDILKIDPDPDTEGDQFELPPGQPIAVEALKVKKLDEGRGGAFSRWLASRLVGNAPGVTNIAEAWQAAVPPLYREGTKVQTPWVFQFLQNPEQLRYTTVLRMPKFNMSPDEAQSLANYFAAVDDVPFPYQTVPPQEPDVKERKAEDYAKNYPNAEHDYLTASWLVLNGPICRQCHSVGGNPVTETDPTKLKRGPNLRRVEERLRPEWVKVWITNPKWITPYTSMPVNFPPGKQSQLTALFGGNNPRQIEAAIDALFNYTWLMETHGPTAYNPPGLTPVPAASGGEE